MFFSSSRHCCYAIFERSRQCTQRWLGTLKKAETSQLRFPKKKKKKQIWRAKKKHHQSPAGQEWANISSCFTPSPQARSKAWALCSVEPNGTEWKNFTFPAKKNCRKTGTEWKQSGLNVFVRARPWLLNAGCCSLGDPLTQCSPSVHAHTNTRTHTNKDSCMPLHIRSTSPTGDWTMFWLRFRQ